MKKISATDFKARCLKLIDQVHDTGKPLTITKRGRVVAVLQPAGQDHDRPWLRLRGTVKWYDDPFKPAIDESEIDALK